MARLIDADALLEKFNNIPDIWSALKYKKMADDFDLYCKVADAIKLTPTAGGWISVKDQLPDDGLVGKLVYDRENGAQICREVVTMELENGEKRFSANKVLIEYLFSMSKEKIDPKNVTCITHWMRLPEPPEAEDGAESD